jgi:hypothetical protein
MIFAPRPRPTTRRVTMWMREVPSTIRADAEVTGRFFGNNEFSERRFAAIAKPNYGATLELKLARPVS